MAEQLVLDDISTGASNDLERATSTARSMVTRYGFSEKLGPIVYGNDQNEVFLGRDLGSSRDYSDRVAGEIDARHADDEGQQAQRQVAGVIPVFPQLKRKSTRFCAFAVPFIRNYDADRCSSDSLSASMAMNSPFVGLSSFVATRQPNALLSVSMRPLLHATSMAWRMARSTLLAEVL